MLGTSLDESVRPRKGNIFSCLELSNFVDYFGNFSQAGPRTRDEEVIAWLEEETTMTYQHV